MLTMMIHNAIPHSHHDEENHEIATIGHHHQENIFENANADLLDLLSLLFEGHEHFPHSDLNTARTANSLKWEGSLNIDFPLIEVQAWDFQAPKQIANELITDQDLGRPKAAIPEAHLLRGPPSLLLV